MRQQTGQAMARAASLRLSRPQGQAIAADAPLAPTQPQSIALNAESARWQRLDEQALDEITISFTAVLL